MKSLGSVHGTLDESEAGASLWETSRDNVKQYSTECSAGWSGPVTKEFGQDLEAATKSYLEVKAMIVPYR